MNRIARPWLFAAAALAAVACGAPYHATASRSTAPSTASTLTLEATSEAATTTLAPPTDPPTTPAPPTTAAPAPPPPAPVTAAPAPTAPASRTAAAGPARVTGSSSFEACVIQRESSGNPSAGSGGLYGILPSTWHSLGYSGTAAQASVAQQRAAFEQLYARYGKAPWSAYDGCR